MADEVIPVVPDPAATAPVEAPAASAAPAADPPAVDIPAMQSALKKANKEAETLRLKVANFEEANKTESQKLLDRAELAEKELATTRMEALRSRVALSKGLPAEMADRLRGDDEDAMSADADRLAALLKPRPVVDPDQGAREGSSGSIDVQIAQATAAGNHTLAIALKQQRAASLAKKS